MAAGVISSFFLPFRPSFLLSSRVWVVCCIDLIDSLCLLGELSGVPLALYLILREISKICSRLSL